MRNAGARRLKRKKTQTWFEPTGGVRTIFRRTTDELQTNYRRCLNGRWSNRVLFIINKNKLPGLLLYCMPFMLNMRHQKSIVKLNRPFGKNSFILKKTGLNFRNSQRLNRPPISPQFQTFKFSSTRRIPDSASLKEFRGCF